MALAVATVLPRYMMASPIREQSEIIRSFAEAGFATVVMLPLRTPKAVLQARSQIEALVDSAAPLVLFLERLKRVRIIVDDCGAEKVTTLSRRVEMLGLIARDDESATYGLVDLGSRGKYCVIWQRLNKADILQSVEASIADAPQLKSWLQWEGEAAIAIAIPLNTNDNRAHRLYNFLPMGAETTAPMPCFVDAPFFSDIDRRSANLLLPLNAFLLNAVADLCVKFVLGVGRTDNRVPQHACLDVVSWSSSQIKTLTNAFAKAGSSLSEVTIIPAISRRGHRRWTSLQNVVRWVPKPFVNVDPIRIAELCDAPIVATLSQQHLDRLERLVRSVAHRGISPLSSQLASWIETLTREMAASAKATGKVSWSSLYNELPHVFELFECNLGALKNRQVLMQRNNQLGVAGLDAEGLVPLYRVRERADTYKAIPLPPASVSRKLRFIDETIVLSPETLLAFKAADLLREYDGIEALNSLSATLSRTSGQVALAEVLSWTFRLWRASPERAILPLQNANLKVPTREGWTAAKEATFSSRWTLLGKTLEPFLIEMAADSEDCEVAAQTLIVDFEDWPSQVKDASKKQWLDFLGLLGVNDGLRPKHDDGTYSLSGDVWNDRMSRGNVRLGCDEAWRKAVGSRFVSFPNTQYRLQGHVWRFPGQLEYSVMSSSARERMSDLLIGFLKTEPQPFFAFTIGRFERNASRQDIRTLPTPLAVFLKEAPWLRIVDGGEATFACPTRVWSSSAKNRTPRFVPHLESSLGDELAEDESLAALMFGPDVGIMNWSSPSSAGSRLKALADCFYELAAGDRQRFRNEYRRAWSDFASSDLLLADDAHLVVRRSSKEEVVVASELTEPLLITDDTNSFRARALATAGRAVLAVEEGQTEAVEAVLVASSIPAALLDALSVQLLVDGETFVPLASDQALLKSDLEWLSRLMLLAHETKADGLERSANGAAMDQRLRSIRTRFCSSWALVIDGGAVPPDDANVYIVDDLQQPTLVISGVVELDWSVLLDSAANISRLLDSRLRSFEMALLRLHSRVHELRAPSDDELARAVGIESSQVRDYAAAASANDESARRLLPALINYYFGIDAAKDFLTADFEGVSGMRAWMEIIASGSDTLDIIFQAVQQTANPSALRSVLGLDFERYNRALLELGEPPLSDEVDLRRQFSAFIAEIRPALVDELRNLHLDEYRSGLPLTLYTKRKTLQFITFDAQWLICESELSRSVVETRARACLHKEIKQQSTIGHDLPSLTKVLEANRTVVRNAVEVLKPLVRAWCVKNVRPLPTSWSALDAQLIVRDLENQGLLDFDAVTNEDAVYLIARGGLWPDEMPVTVSAELLGLDFADVDREEQLSRKQIETTARLQRSVNVAGQPLDTADPNFAQSFVQIAEEHRDRLWFSSLKTARLNPLASDFPPRKRSRRENGGPWRGGKSTSDAYRRAMGLFGEWLAYQYLQKRHPALADETCWKSSNRTHFFGGSEGDDALGYDFRIETATVEWLYEVKSTVDDSCEFEFTANEMTTATGASGDRKRRYRILYVPFVLDPERWTVQELPNPMGDTTRDCYRIVGRASARMRFDLA